MEGKKILLVDDEKDVRGMIARILEHAGYRVVTASNGEEAIEIARKEMPNLILLDIRMPKMDGTQAGEIFKKMKETKNIPIIYLTGLLSKDEEKELKHHIAGNFFLAKPCDKKELLEEIAKRI